MTCYRDYAAEARVEERRRAQEKVNDLAALLNSEEILLAALKVALQDAHVSLDAIRRKHLKERG